jgi:ribosome-associated translation inhibitor RaiA
MTGDAEFHRQLTTMQIFVVNDIAVPEQTRAYAEYRMFTGLARLSRLVEDVEVRLDSGSGNGSAGTDGSEGTDGADVICVVCVQTTSGKHARVRARGRHLHDAINRAADRISQRLREVAKA